jgi:alpha-1,6-mannosyltransferase
MTHIVQVANFYSPTSGGLRTALDNLRIGYAAAGHEVTLVVPGARSREHDDGIGRCVELRGPRVPGGYRVIARPFQLRAALAALRPDRVEVSDKLLAIPAAAEAQHLRVPVVLMSHERLDGILAPRLPRAFPLTAVADRCNRVLGSAVSKVVCASEYASEEFERVGVRVSCVPLGVDLDTFHPGAGIRSPDPLVVCAGRLSFEKRPDIVVGALKLLACSGTRVRAVFVGDGPLRDRLVDRAGGLPIEFVGHINDRRQLASLLASAWVVVAPCPVETFGLSVLEAMACGTPVAVAPTGAARELLAPGAGWIARSSAGGFADAIAAAIEASPRVTAPAARRRAMSFPWAATVERMLEVHAIHARVAA